MSILQHTDFKVISVLLFGDTSFDNNEILFICEATVEYITLTGRFNEPLLNCSSLSKRW